jgi:hypothetical protein
MQAVDYELRDGDILRMSKPYSRTGGYIHSMEASADLPIQKEQDQGTIRKRLGSTVATPLEARFGALRACGLPVAMHAHI